MNTSADNYFTDGCGRCSFGGTPRCKVNNWTEELKQLRRIVLECGLIEESKWGVPCYTFQNKNIVIVAAFKEYAALSFFKGTLISDTNKILDKAGVNSRSARLIKFTNPQQVVEMETLLKATVFEAIEVEKAGLKVNFKKKTELVFPEELENKFEEDPFLKTAFEALTPGRQRGYLLYFSAPKQAKTRVSRIEKCIQQILSGKGLNDR